MRILHVTDDLAVGGSQLVLTELANSQVAAGHQVAVAAGSGNLWQELDPSIIRHEHAGGRLSRRELLLSMRRLLVVQPWDVVHTHQRGVSTAVWLTRRGTYFAHVEHVHSVFPTGSFRRTSFRGDALIACGSAITRMLVDDYGRAPSRVHTIPNGVRDHGVRRKPRPAGDGVLRVLNIGRVDQVKDPERFVRVLAELAGRGIEFRATWIGDGSLLAPARRLVHEAELSGFVEFPGGRRPAVDALADTDVFFLTSVKEGLPLSVIEAGAAGCAVVAPDVGSLTDVIRHGYNGWLYSPDARPSEVADLLAEVASGPGILNRTGTHAREVFERGFEFSRVYRDIEEVYQRLAYRP
jgi:glycosyltransferase involved in cell wall biosynthesis